MQSCREYELETGSKLREEGGGRVLIEQSEAIAQLDRSASGGRLMLLNLT